MLIPWRVRVSASSQSIQGETHQGIVVLITLFGGEFGW